jgi:hypothetical protein
MLVGIMLSELIPCPIPRLTAEPSLREGMVVDDVVL